jgi:putative heme iron utilization protein
MARPAEPRGAVGHSPFPPDEHTAVVTHLATDHAEELLLLARAFGGGPDVTVARLTAMDQDGLHLELTLRVGTATSRRLWVPFPHRVGSAAQLDREFALLVRTARHALGLPPAPDPT